MGYVLPYNLRKFEPDTYADEEARETFFGEYHEAVRAAEESPVPVSYTHLDVYKRQILQCSGVVCANQHGFMMVKGYMKKEKEGEYLKLLGSSVWASVMVYDEWGKAGVLFTGVVTDGAVSYTHLIFTLEVQKRRKKGKGFNFY